MEQIYLDYNASAPLVPPARRAMVAALDLANASSVHAAGRIARQAVTNARNSLADFLSVRPAQIIFNSGATEGLATALHSSSRKNILICATEHEALRANAPGATVVPVQANGLLDLHALEKNLVQMNDALLAVQFVNNETGTIQPIADIIAVAKKHGAMVLVDAAQAMGKIDMTPAMAADMLVISAHKFGGPKGVGALVLREGLAITPLINGGGQEERRRGGTENVAAIAGMGAAIESIPEQLAKQKDLENWRSAMEKEIAAALPQVKIFNGAPRVGNTSMVALPGVAAATQLMNLDLAGICVSSGAACSSGKVGPSHTLLAMGEDENTATGTIRISGGWNSSQKDYQSFTRFYLDMAGRLA